MNRDNGIIICYYFISVEAGQNYLSGVVGQKYISVGSIAGVI